MFFFLPSHLQPFLPSSSHTFSPFYSFAQLKFFARGCAHRAMNNALSSWSLWAEEGMRRRNIEERRLETNIFYPT
jgi:hypothetical protein